MNKELLESNWVQARESLRNKWSNLTDEDIRQINGRYDQLVAKLQQRYGYTRDEAEEELRKWSIDKSSFTYGHDKSYVRPERDDSFRREADNSTFLKWLLALGIPLLLIASYFMYQNAKAPEGTFSQPTNQEFNAVASPADQAINQNINRAIAANSMTAADVNNLRIDTTNGVVNVSGTVATSQERDTILQIIRNVAGVKQINNQMEVR